MANSLAHKVGVQVSHNLYIQVKDKAGIMQR